MLCVISSSLILSPIGSVNFYLQFCLSNNFKRMVLATSLTAHHKVKNLIKTVAESDLVRFACFYSEHQPES